MDQMFSVGECADQGNSRTFSVSRKVPQYRQHAVVNNSAETFIFDQRTGDAPVGDAASRVASGMISELRLHTAANVIEQFLQTLVVL
ncbi:hypothetical protein TNCV_333881 [Trichonephila clavipes]|nr:hypothetical protein TNCV_333881 [Trichonephila clavipes]